VGDAAIAENVTADQMGQVAAALRRLEAGGANTTTTETAATATTTTKEGRTRGVVYYTSIGNETALPPDRVSALCRRLHPKLECRRLVHLPNATEAATLSRLHEYCAGPAAAPPSARVIYLHSKGSYHDHGKQRPWRRSLTAAALHPDCLHPPDDRCHVCGAQFYTMWGAMFPGNMWTARCDYIRRLLPPVEGGAYARRREEAVGRFLALRAAGVMENTLGWHQDVFFGLDRYQWEHWVGSHPDIVPCDLHDPATVAFWDMTQVEVGEDRYRWGVGPRRHMVFDRPAINGPSGQAKQHHAGQRGSDSNFRQYHYTVGHLLRWIGLYGAVPSLDAWAWDHFPVGDQWRDLVAEHGTASVDVVIEQSGMYRSAFAVENISTSGKLDNAGMVVFYHITYPADNEEKAKALVAIKAQFDVLSKVQYGDSTEAFDQEKNALLYYTVAGGSSAEGSELVARLCGQYSDRITCQPLGVYGTESVSGETLRQLHAFCGTRPTSHSSLAGVVYIENQLSDASAASNDHRYNVTAIATTTRAVLSTACSPTANCNACGAAFHPLPFPHFTENMFAASCDYVRMLLPPDVHERRMDEVSAELLLGLLRRRFTSERCGTTPRDLGLRPHAPVHWIGGSPGLRPCSAAPDVAAAQANREAGRARTFREHCGLAGQAFRWSRLYGAAPEPGSWAWRWYPDGPLWEGATRAAGADAVDAIARLVTGVNGGSMEQFWAE